MDSSEKYTFRPIEGIDMATTHGMVLSHVRPGSTVLECGCASGYMTKYMKEQMMCTVDIVEIDGVCFAEARKYARNACNEDLDIGVWAELLKDQRYDCILFADVLEHLKDPKKTLERAAGLMKAGGRIVFSVPNVCHNDILIRMFEDEFIYTETGLLDSTHLRFFSWWGLYPFVHDCGLNIESIGTMEMQTGQTEQGKLRELVRPELMELLKKRKRGEVYQYIVTCRKAGEE